MVSESAILKIISFTITHGIEDNKPKYIKMRPREILNELDVNIVDTQHRKSANNKYVPSRRSRSTAGAILDFFKDYGMGKQG